MGSRCSRRSGLLLALAGRGRRLLLTLAGRGRRRGKKRRCRRCAPRRCRHLATWRAGVADMPGEADTADAGVTDAGTACVSASEFVPDPAEGLSVVG